MPTVLVTAFEPFGGEATNPSMAVVEAVAAAWDRDEELVTAVLPVAFAGADAALLELIAEHAPAVVVSVGLAAGRPGPALERVAVNLMDARIPDNDGARPIDEPVLADGPLALAAAMPVKAAVARAIAAGDELGLSLSAGSFVCNAVFYRLADWSARAGTRSGFLHVPHGAVPASAAALRHALDAALDDAAEPAVPGGALH